MAAMRPAARARPERRPAPAPAAGGGRERTRFVDGYLSYLLARASHQVSREFHARLKPYGLSVLEWRVLASLADTDGLSVGELADAVLYKQPTVTKLIDRMAAQGWVERRARTGDRRRVVIAMTARGQQVIQELLAQAKAHEAACLASYAPEEIEALKRILRDLLQRSAPGAR